MPLPYQAQTQILTNAELDFYHTLKMAVGEKATICPKMRIADVLSVPNTKERYILFNNIKAKHIDFVLCDPNTMKPIGAIELDDSSHQRYDRQQRDKFVNSAFQSAGIPLIHIRNKRYYETGTVAEQLKEIFQPTKPAKQHTTPQNNLPRKTTMLYPFGPRLTKQEEDTYWNFIILMASLFAGIAALAACFIFGTLIYLIATK